MPSLDTGTGHRSRFRRKEQTVAVPYDVNSVKLYTARPNLIIAVLAGTINSIRRTLGKRVQVSLLSSRFTRLFVGQVSLPNSERRWES